MKTFFKIIPITHCTIITILLSGFISISNTYCSDADKMNAVVKDIKNEVYSKLKKDYEDHELLLLYGGRKKAIHDGKIRELLHYEQLQSRCILCKSCLSNISLSSKIDKSLDRLLLTSLNNEEVLDTEQAVKSYKNDLTTIFDPLKIYNQSITTYKIESTIKSAEDIALDSYENAKEALSNELLNTTKSTLLALVKEGRACLDDLEIEKINECFLWIRNNFNTIKPSLFVPDELNQQANINHENQPNNDKKTRIWNHPAIFASCIILLCISGYFNIKCYLKNSQGNLSDKTT